MRIRTKKRERNWNCSNFRHFKKIGICHHVKNISFTCFSGHFIITPVNNFYLISIIEHLLFGICWTLRKDFLTHGQIFKKLWKTIPRLYRFRFVMDYNSLFHQKWTTRNLISVHELDPSMLDRKWVLNQLVRECFGNQKHKFNHNFWTCIRLIHCIWYAIYPINWKYIIA